MSPTINLLLARIRSLEDELEHEYNLGRDALARQHASMAEHFLELQRRHKVALWPYLQHSRWPVLLTSPLIYAGWPVFALLDAFVSLYQAACFRVYGVPRVRRSDYLVFDRADLPYLNLVERFNCFYCSYANGLIAYAREIAARTEQYWCPIKHARRVVDAHGHYPQYFAHGDAEAFRLGQQRLRDMLADAGALEPEVKPPAPPEA